LKPNLTPETTPTREDLDRRPGPVLVEFGTDWCGHCRALESFLSSLLAENPKVQHLKVEDGPGRPLGRSFGVRLWPNLVFLKDGVVVRQLARPSHAEIRDAFAAVSAP
jgi:thioredoxin 1